MTETRPMGRLAQGGLLFVFAFVTWIAFLLGAVLVACGNPGVAVFMWLLLGVSSLYALIDLAGFGWIWLVLVPVIATLVLVADPLSTPERRHRWARAWILVVLTAFAAGAAVVSIFGPHDCEMRGIR
ncbi:MAG: hypothetical protein ACJ8G1_22425 [Vitreoscilla sp.]